MAETSNLFPVLNLAKVKKSTETDRRLPTWLSLPTKFPAVNLIESGQDIDELASYIDDDLRRYLRRNMLIERVFPVQKCLIPTLSTLFESRHLRRPNDICVSSPTGSGKTLAYAIPIVNHLNKSLVRSLRALVILPTHDLASQVFKTFQQVSAPTHLRCALATGDKPDLQKGFFKKVTRSLTQADNEHTNQSFSSIISYPNSELTNDKHSDDYVSTIDILISTPGILVDLIHNAPGFSLKELEILVMDEADRLMTSHKHDWLKTIERSIFSRSDECICDEKVLPVNRQNLITMPINNKRRMCFSSPTACSIAHSIYSKPLHKLLFSATLTCDPQILMQMNLYQPRLFLSERPGIALTKIRNSLGSQNSTPSASPVPSAANTPNLMVNTRNEFMSDTAIPEQLAEKMFIIEAKERLFIIWYLMHELRYKKVICFTNHLSTSSKLCKFMNEIDGVRAVEFSSNLKQETRQKYLTEFKADKIEVIVSTDLMARGMDVEGVDFVISYDMPKSEISYVHRVGRTARADKSGTAITLVDTKELIMFKKVVQLAHKLPNSMRLSHVVEEMKVPPSLKKNPEKYGLYTKTLENYEDAINKKMKFVKKVKQ